MENTANLSQNCLKRLFVTFAVLTVDASNKNDYKLDKILRNFYKVHFIKILMVFVAFEFEICALMRLFSSLLNIHVYDSICP